MRMFFFHIVNFRQTSKALLYILLLGTLFFSTGFTLPEKVENLLKQIPYLNKVLKKEKVPNELLEKTQKALEKVFWEGAPKFAPKPWQKAQDYFQKAQKALEEKNYRYTQFYLEKSLEWAKKAEEKAIKERKRQKIKAQEKLKKFLTLHSEIKKDPNWQIKIRLLEEFIKYEKFEEFEKEFKKIQEELKKGGQAPF